MKRQKQITLVFLLWMIGVFSLPNFGFAQELNVDFEEQLVLGDDPDAPMEYQFGGVRALDTDNQGRIYIAGANNDIRVFSPEGEHITTFGGRGRGPGEFNEISAMAVGEKGEVIINDRWQFRVTYFFNLGDSVETYSLENRKVRQGRQMPQKNIVPLKDERYAITSKMRDTYYDRPPEDLDNRVVHIVPEDFSEFEVSMFDVYEEQMFDPNEPLERKMATDWKYYLARLPNEKLVLSHEIYDGTIYIMKVNGSKKDIKKVEGEFAGRERYKMLNGDLKELKRRGITSIVMSNSPLGRFYYQKSLESEGLFTNENWIINVISVADDTEISYYMEFFDANDGNYKGYISIDDDFNTHVQNSIRQLFYPQHLDNQNQLFYVDYSDEVPVIRVTKISVD